MGRRTESGHPRPLTPFAPVRPKRPKPWLSTPPPGRSSLIRTTVWATKVPNICQSCPEPFSSHEGLPRLAVRSPRTLRDCCDLGVTPSLHGEGRLFATRRARKRSVTVGPNPSEHGDPPASAASRPPIRICLLPDKGQSPANTETRAREGRRRRRPRPPQAPPGNKLTGRHTRSKRTGAPTRLSLCV